MNKSRKISLLYQKAHGKGTNATSEEQRELRKYRVCADDGNYATKANIGAYVNAVDNGCRLSFYDWCMNNHKMDRRRRGSSESEMAADNRDRSISVMMFGWLLWGMAIYWTFHGTLKVGTCAVAGAVLSAVLLHLNRRWAGFTIILLPLIIAAVAYGR